MLVLLILTLVYSNSYIESAEAKPFATIHNCKIEFAYETIELAHDALKSYDTELNKITTGKTFQEMIETISVRRVDVECEITEAVLDIKCVLRKPSIRDWCSGGVRIFRAYLRVKFGDGKNEISNDAEEGLLEMLEAGIKKFEEANANLTKISLSINETAKELMKLHAYLNNEFTVVNEFVGNQTVDDKLNSRIKYKFQSFEQFHDELKSRIDKAGADMDNVKIVLDNEIEHTKVIITKLRGAYTSLNEDTGIKESVNELMAAWEEYHKILKNREQKNRTLQEISETLKSYSRFLWK